jgi:hypothetical protein
LESEFVLPRGTLRSNWQSPGNSSRLSHQDASVPARELAREARLPGRIRDTVPVAAAAAEATRVAS